MAKQKIKAKIKTKARTKYLVLVTITNKKTGMEFQPGSHIVTGDFSASVIKNWLEIKPPVLIKIEQGEDVAFAGSVEETPDGKEVADG